MSCMPFGECRNLLQALYILPGPVRRRLIDTDNTNKGNSYPSTNPFGTNMMVAPIISIINSIAAILVRIPINIAKPPITSNSQLVASLQLANQPYVKISVVCRSNPSYDSYWNRTKRS